jgi:hypothetical protein
MKLTGQQKAVWNDFANSSDLQDVTESLTQGLAVVHVLGDGYSATASGCDTEMANPHLVAMRLQEAMVQQTGVPLPVASDGRRRFAMLVWKANDAVDAPSEIATVALGDDRDREMLAVAQATGRARCIGIA